MTDTEIFTYIGDRLKARFDVKRMVLFGSRAKGTARSDSDYDILVVAESEIPFVPRQGIALLSLGKRQFPVDLLVYTPAEFEREASVLGSIAYWVQREGKEYIA